MKGANWKGAGLLIGMVTASSQNSVFHSIAFSRFSRLDGKRGGRETTARLVSVLMGAAQGSKARWGSSVLAVNKNKYKSES